MQLFAQKTLHLRNPDSTELPVLEVRKTFCLIDVHQTGERPHCSQNPHNEPQLQSLMARFEQWLYTSNYLQKIVHKEDCQPQDPQDQRHQPDQSTLQQSGPSFAQVLGMLLTTERKSLVDFACGQHTQLLSGLLAKVVPSR